MAGDWIKLHRKSRESQAFAKPDLWKLWCLCLMKANFQDTWVDVDGLAAPVRVERGQFLTGRYALHRDFYVRPTAGDKSPLTVWRWLEALRDMGNVNIETNSRYSRVTVVNYETYQSDKSENDQPMFSRCSAGDQPDIAVSSCKSGVSSTMGPGNDQPVISRRSAGDQPTITVKNEKNEKKKRKEPKPIFDPLSVELPFCSSLFQKAWSDFCAHRQSGSHPLSELAVAKLLAKCGKFGEADAVAALDAAVENDWRGIFRPKGMSDASPSPSSPPPPYVN